MLPTYEMIENNTTDIEMAENNTTDIEMAENNPIDRVVERTHRPNTAVTFLIATFTVSFLVALFLYFWSGSGLSVQLAAGLMVFCSMFAHGLSPEGALHLESLPELSYFLRCVLAGVATACAFDITTIAVVAISNQH